MVKKVPIYFSIDFEDFFFDTCRNIGCKKPGSKLKALEVFYEQINEISKIYCGSKKFTFFVTGIVAKNSPDLIRQIHSDGHEIASHYNYHDRISLQDRDELGRNLDECIEIIEKIIGRKPLGFRAPFFGIEKNNHWAYEEIAKRFKYDSSYRTTESLDSLNRTNLIFKRKQLHEFYIYGKPILRNLFSIRTGGTYLRLFPSNRMISTLLESYEKGHHPLLYVHPYDILKNQEFRVPWTLMNELSFIPRSLFWIRQFQWTKLGHSQAENKLITILKFFEHQGPMKLLLRNR
jgi:hypothetical protein